MAGEASKEQIEFFQQRINEVEEEEEEPRGKPLADNELDEDEAKSYTMKRQRLDLDPSPPADSTILYLAAQVQSDRGLKNASRAVVADDMTKDQLGDF